MKGSCENGNGLMGSIKFVKFLGNWPNGVFSRTRLHGVSMCNIRNYRHFLPRQHAKHDSIDTEPPRERNNPSAKIEQEFHFHSAVVPSRERKLWRSAGNNHTAVGYGSFVFPYYHAAFGYN
jgi:hypothetical protein